MRRFACPSGALCPTVGSKLHHGLPGGEICEPLVGPWRHRSQGRGGECELHELLATRLRPPLLHPEEMLGLLGINMLKRMSKGA